MSVHIANQIIKKEWTDYNNHMNMAYYILVFDQVWELMLEKFKMGEMSAKTTSMSTMVVETHTTYNSEVKEGDEVEVNLTFFDHDKKRLHYKMEMIEKSSKKLSATTEVLSLYINLDARKVSEFEEEKVNLMDDFINLNSLKFSNKDLILANKLKNNMEVKLLSGALGAEIKGINLTDVSDENFKKINDLLLEHKVIFLEISQLLKISK